MHALLFLLFSCGTDVDPVDPEAAAAPDAANVTPPSTPLLIDYMMGRKPSERFVAPEETVTDGCVPYISTVVLVIDAKRYKMEICPEFSHGSPGRLIVNARPNGSEDWTQFHTDMEGKLLMATCTGDGHVFCDRWDLWDNPTPEYNAYFAEQWRVTSARLIAYYEGR